jgi:hypothetical protein
MSSIDPKYPIWAELVDTSAGASSPGSPRRGGGGTTSPTTSAISDVLGWRLNLLDTAGIRRALTEAFEVKKVDGKSIVRWRPRSFRVQSVQRGEGAIGGAQLSLWERAKVVVDQATALLNQLTSLGTDQDVQNIEAIRAMIEPELTELVDQLGAEGGPVVQRIDTLFTLLVEYDPTDVDLDPLDAGSVRGQLGLLRTRLELEAGNVNDITEERELTRFVTLVSYIDMILQSWHNERSLFDRTGTDGSLATQTTLLERRLSVVVESVGEVQRALRSVFVDEAEQEAILLDAGDEEAEITIAELLEWIVFSAERGFEILRVSGRDGAVHGLTPLLRRLETVLQRVIENIGSATPALNTARVTTSFDELLTHVAAAHRLASEIQRGDAPVITALMSNGRFRNRMQATQSCASAASASKRAPPSRSCTKPMAGSRRRRSSGAARHACGRCSIFPARRPPMNGVCA